MLQKINLHAIIMYAPIWFHSIFWVEQELFFLQKD